MIKRILFFFYIILISFQKDCIVGGVTTLEKCQSQCRIKYSGNKNYFNASTGLCEQASQCTENQDTNKCVEKQSNQQQKNSTDWDHGDLNGNINVIKNKKIKCEHGTYIKDGGSNSGQDQCICNNGYGDSGKIENDVIIKCDIKVDNSGKAPNYGNESEVKQHTKDLIEMQQSQTLILGIPKYYFFAGVFVLSLTLLICCCCCFCFYRRRKMKQSGKYKQKKQQKNSNKEQSQSSCQDCEDSIDMSSAQISSQNKNTGTLNDSQQDGDSSEEYDDSQNNFQGQDKKKTTKRKYNKHTLKPDPKVKLGIPFQYQINNYQKQNPSSPQKRRRSTIKLK